MLEGFRLYLHRIPEPSNPKDSLAELKEEDVSACENAEGGNLSLEHPYSQRYQHKESCGKGIVIAGPLACLCACFTTDRHPWLFTWPHIYPSKRKSMLMPFGPELPLEGSGLLRFSDRHYATGMSDALANVQALRRLGHHGVFLASPVCVCVCFSGSFGDFILCPQVSAHSVNESV